MAILLVLSNLAVYAVIGALVLNPPAQETAAETGGEPLELASLPLLLPTPTEVSIPAFSGFPTPTPLAQVLPAAKSAPTPAARAGATPAPKGPAAPPPSPSPVRPTPTLPVFLPEDAAKLNLPDTINIIIMGSDRRPGWRTWRTDALMIVSIHQKTNSVTLISIPRDLWVRLPGYGNERINSADLFGELYHYPGGGPALLKQTIKDNLGVRIHYYVRVDFESFQKAVDTLGGIDVDVDCRIDLWDVWGGLVIEPGLQHMDGQTALFYSRGRLTTSDFDRSRRQRKVLMAIWEKARQLGYLTRWPELYSQFRDGIATDMGVKEIGSLALFGAKLSNERIKMSGLDYSVVRPMTTAAGEQVLVAQPAQVNSAINQALAGPDPNLDAMAQEKATLDVLSSDGTTQTADLVLTTLRRQGFNTRTAALAPEPAKQTQLWVYADKPHTVQLLTQQFQIAPANVRQIRDTAMDVDLQLLLAQDYRACGH